MIKALVLSLCLLAPQESKPPEAPKNDNGKFNLCIVNVTKSATVQQKALMAGSRKTPALDAREVKKYSTPFQGKVEFKVTKKHKNGDFAIKCDKFTWRVSKKSKLAKDWKVGESKALQLVRLPSEDLLVERDSPTKGYIEFKLIESPRQDPQGRPPAVKNPKVGAIPKA